MSILQTMMKKHLFLTYLLVVSLPCFAQQKGATREMVNGDEIVVTDSTTQQKVDYHFCEAVKYMANTNYVVARQEFNRCMELDSNVAAVHFNLGVLDFYETKTDLAIPHLEKAYQLSPDFLSYGQALLNVYVKSQQLDKAVKIGEELISRFPNDDRTYRLLINLYSHMGKDQNVMKTFDRLENIVGLEEILMDKIEFYCNTYPESKSKKLCVSEYKRFLESTNANVEKQSIFGELYLAFGDEKKAMSIFNQLMQEYPNSGRPYLSLYTYYDDKNDSVRAIEMLKKAMMDKSIPYSSFSDGVLTHLSGLVQNKRFAEADEFMKIVRHNFGDEAEVCNLSARLCYEEKKIDEAIDYARTVIDFKPDAEQSWSFLASIYGAENNDTALFQLSNEALALFPNSSEWQYYRIVYFARHDMTDSLYLAIDHLVNNLPESASNNMLKSSVLEIKSSILWEKKQTKRALEACEQSLKYNPNNATVLNNYAYFLALCDTNLNKALTMIEQSLKIDNKQANSLDTYAYVLFKKGDYRSARFFMERAINMADKAVRNHYLEHYGNILFHLGDVAGALEQWKTALETIEDPSDNLKKKVETQTYIPDQKIIIE